MQKPNLPAIDARKVLKAKGFETGAARPVVVIGVRGYFLNSMGAAGKNDRGIYDDAAIVCLTDRCLNFNFNTDPSAYREGIATLALGIWYFIAGKHKVNYDAPRGYPAFRQFGQVKVLRDGEPSEVGNFGINLHHGGNSGTSSLGCQTVPPDQWDEFRTTVYKALGTSDSAVLKSPLGVAGCTFPYILIDRVELEKIIGRSL